MLLSLGINISIESMPPDAPPAVNVIDAASDDEVIAAVELLKGAGGVIALDCEGVDLGRDGALCFVQLSARNQCFLFDVMGLDSTSQAARSLKELLEDPTIVKIIHDCKADSDALFHILGIRLQGVHDTQAWDCVCLVTNGDEKVPGKSLNVTLQAWGFAVAESRDASVYQKNPAFWAERPMSPQMLDWASGDVTCLFQLYDLQVEKATPEQKVVAIEASSNNAELLRSKQMISTHINPSRIGRFIGKGGANIRALHEKLQGVFFQLRHGEAGLINVYYQNEDLLAVALSSLQSYR
jgi:exonuclease 3'-5' domain-containing protein 1